MQRYFVPSKNIHLDHAYLVGQDFHHLKNVMRRRLGDEVVILSENGKAFLGKIQSLDDSEARIDFIQELENPHQNSHITIAQALIKRERFEWVLEKATELGMESFIPTAFERSIIKIEPENEAKKLIRYQTIIKEAAEQSRRFEIPKVLPVVKSNQLPFDQYDKILICYEGASKDDGLVYLAKTLSPSQKILVIIGPEGGISPHELAFFQSKGGVICSLGKRIVRSETAALVFLAYLNTLWEC